MTERRFHGVLGRVTRLASYSMGLFSISSRPGRSGKQIVSEESLPLLVRVADVVSGTWEFDATAFISHCNPVGKNPRKPERVANNEIQVWKPETDCGIYFSYYDPHKSTQLKTVEVPLDLECDLKDGSGTAVIYAYIVPRGVSNYLWLFARKDGKEVQIPADDYGAGLIMRHGTWELSPDVRRQFEEGGLIKKTMLIDALVEDDALDSGRHAALEVPSSDRPKRRRRETAKATELKRKKLG